MLVALGIYAGCLYLSFTLYYTHIETLSDQEITKRFTMKNFSILLVLLLSIVAACGNGGLSRQEAKVLIQDHFEKNPATARFPIGELAGSRGNDISVRACTNIFAKSLPEYEYLAALQQGLIEFHPLGQRQSGYIKVPVCRVDLTEKAKLYSLGKSENLAIVKLADKVVVEITGVIKLAGKSGRKASAVSYKWKHHKPTPFGEIFLPDHLGGSQESSITLVLYDDGWRLPEG